MFDEEQKFEKEEQAEMSVPEQIEEESNKEDSISEENKEEEPLEEEQKTPETEIPVINVIEPVVLTEEQIEKKEIKKVARALGISFLIMTAIVLSFSFLTVKVLDILGFGDEKKIELLTDPAVVQVMQIFFSIIIFTIPFILVSKIYRYRISDLINFNKPKKKTVLPLLFIGIAICAFSNIASSMAGYLFESMGIRYEVVYAENPDGIFGFLLSLLATVVVPALVEEFACRGIILGVLRKFGDTFAILISSLFFGLMHSNFEQIPFAFFVGVALAFVTIKSGSIWLAVLIHAFNNSISVIFAYFLSGLSVFSQNVIYTVFLVVELLLGIISLLFIDQKEIFEFENTKTKNSNLKKIGYFVLSVPVLIYIFFCLYSSLEFFY